MTTPVDGHGPDGTSTTADSVDSPATTASDSDSESESEPKRLNVLTFDLAGDRYCVSADAVASVLGISETEPLEGADDPWNAGSVTARGERIRVVDLPRVFTSAGRTIERIDDPRLLVLAATDEDGAYYGWLVDDVDVTRTVRVDDLEPTRATARYVRGRFEFDDGSAVLLDERAIHG